MIQVLDIIEDTMVDGPGFRTSIYCAGCYHECPGCHNPQSWNPEGGHPMTTDEVMKIIVADPYANVTFSGGDPCIRQKALPSWLVPFVARLKRPFGVIPVLPLRPS